MQPLVAVVTGANRGIGFEVAKGLCQELNQRGIVYIASRDEAKGLAAVEALRKYNCHPKFYKVNCTNIEDVEDLKYDLEKWHGGLDILINNAVTYYEPHNSMTFNELAWEIFKLNFYFTMHITGLIWGSIRKHGRVVNVVCENAANMSLFRSDQLRNRFLDPTLSFRRLMILMKEYLEDVSNGTQKENGWPDSPYDLAKIGVVAMTRFQQYQFDKRQARDHIIVNAVNPGQVKSEKNGFKGVVTLGQAAKPIIKLALLPPYTSSPKGKLVWRDLRIVNWTTGALYRDSNLTPVDYSKT